MYLDNIVIYFKTEDEHCKHLEQVLKILIKNKFYTKPLKCTVAVDELKFYKFIIRNGQVRPILLTIKTIKD